MGEHPCVTLYDAFNGTCIQPSKAEVMGDVLFATAGLLSFFLVMVFIWWREKRRL